MQTLAALWVLGASVLVAGCGSSGSSSSPAAPSSSAPAPAPPAPTLTTAPSTSTSGVFTFNFPAGMIASDQDLIRLAVTTQASYFQTAFGRTMTQPTMINGSTTDPGCANPGSSAFTGIRVITICVGNSGWTVHNPLNKQKIVMHEAFHLLQFEMRWLGNPNQDNVSAHWIDEGTAEFMGWNGAAGAGLISYSAARLCMIAQANAQASGSQSLSTMETGAGFGVPGAYQLAMLGIDQLVTPRGMQSLMIYGSSVAGGQMVWPTAFQGAFVMSPIAFYSQFPSYRSSLGAGSDSCGV